MKKILLFLLLAGIAAADTMTYTFSGTASGHCGAQQFSNASFTLTFSADPSTIASPPCCSGILSTPQGTAGTVSIAGAGTQALSTSGDQAIDVNQSARTVGIWHYNTADFLTVANSDFATYALASNAGPDTGTTFFYATPLILADGTAVYFTSVTGATFTAERSSGSGQPSVVSVTPSSDTTGPNTAVTYTFTVSDTAGATNLQGMNILFSYPGQQDPNICWMYYDRPSNTLTVNYQGNWEGSGPVGGAGSGGPNLGATGCKVNTATASATASGNTLTLTLPITMTISPSSPATLPISVNATTAGGVNTGYQNEGTLTLNPSTSPGFTMSGNPAFGTYSDMALGSSASYTITVTPYGGFDGTVYFTPSISQRGQSTTTAFPTVTYNPTNVPAGGSTTMTVTATDPNSVAAWTIGTNAASPYNGTTLTSYGTYQVDIDNAAPTVTAYPYGGSGTTQTFNFTVTDSSSAKAVNGVNILFSPTASGAHACWMYLGAGSFWLANDDGTSWSTQGNLGTGGVVSNSQCSISLPNSAYAYCPGIQGCPANQVLFYVNVKFNPSFAGAQNLYMRASNAAGFDSGYQLIGPWTVP